jgi:5-methylcytosine-specific restriction endonuclease McrA
MTLTRICNDCKEEKILEELVKNVDCKFGRRKLCKACAVERIISNTDKVEKASYDKSRRVLKSEELRAYDRIRSSLPNRVAAHNEATRKRRAILKDAVPEDYDKQGVLAMYNLSQKISKLTGVQMHVDHIVPLALGGKHDVTNLQLLAGVLNVSKGIKTHWQLSHKAYPNVG